ncbi:MAG: hypothetical protein AB2375_00900 [Tissierellaceae bacterium]
MECTKRAIRYQWSNIAFLIIFVLGEKIFSLIDVFSLDNLLDDRLDIGGLIICSVVMLAIYTFIYSNYKF